MRLSCERGNVSSSGLLKLVKLRVLCEQKEVYSRISHFPTWVTVAGTGLKWFDFVLAHSCMVW